ncbi:hypothetical protein GF351_01855 [Candidatus Woesearchaeota archaeon]|nr:hypothetical protein [Candidatus Woesearchaeota archaeon]
MSKNLERIGMTGIGLALITKEEIEKYIDNMVKQGDIKARAGKKMARDLVSKSKKQRQRFENDLQKQIEKAMAKMDIAKKSELDKLKRKVDKLSSQKKKR